ncbi:DUF4267 domain-containing protein [Kibdelosporangium aridum]|uniref:DUF4267 domain-containing protein n=1 Tax=Kibdelosporangium aridum TaxID=2030 RepID=A0A428Y2F1_KIBAR|nr:DUF4267 domain-containing protein [Kibdelosporangium aridum]RSM61773.1 DUF4267 domain-containing protein [Kibdelosporangium aridum]
MHYVGIALAVLTGIGIIVIGVRFLLAPVAMAKNFGLPSWPSTGNDLAWLNLKGIRDITSGLVILIPLAMGNLHLTGWLILASTVTPLGDALTILKYRGNKTTAYSVHAATAVATTVAGVLLLLS